MLKNFSKLTLVLILAITISLTAITGCSPVSAVTDTPTDIPKVTPHESTPVWANTDTPRKYTHPDCIDTPLLREAWKVIFDNYVEPAKINITELNRGAVAGMYEMMELKNPSPDAQPADEWQDIDLILQAWDNIAGIIGKDKLIADCPEQGAINGMVKALNNKYSHYISPIENRPEQILRGKFTGFGFGANFSDKQPVIDRIIKDSPAARAGLSEGDMILSVNGLSTEGMSPATFDAKLRDDSMNVVTLTLRRKNASAPSEIKIEKGLIDIQSVFNKMVGDIAYIQITEFNDDTPDEFKTALNELDLKNTTGMVLDLRGNTGGSLYSVIKVFSYFFMEGTLCITIDNKGNRGSENIHDYYWMYSLEDQPGTDDLIHQPLAILVNKETASGSEALCGALRDYGRAKIAGTTTYGKGSINMFFDLRDGSSIYLTVEHYLTPYGNEVEGKGITPDFILTQTGDDAIQWAVDYLHGNQN